MIEIAVLSRGHDPWSGLGQVDLGAAQGCCYPRNPIHRCLGELVQIGFMIGGAVRHQIGQAVGGLQRIDLATHRFVNVFRITPMACRK